VSKTDAPTNDWEYYQPPLYYIVCVPVYWTASSLFGDQTSMVVRSIRLVSIVLWLINLIVTQKILDRLQVNDTFVRVIVIGMVSLVPTYAFISASINNDNLMITLGGLFLYLLSGNISIGRAVLLGALLGIMLLTKLTAVVFVFALGAVLGVYYLARAVSFTTALSRFLLASTIAAFLWLPWGLRNIRVYGDITAENVANIPYHWRQSADAWNGIPDYLGRSFWSVSGIHNNVQFFPAGGIALIGLAVLGLCYGAMSKRRVILRCLLSDRQVQYLAAMLLAIVVNILLVVRFGILYNQGQGRFLYPMLIPIAIFTALGIKSWPIKDYVKNLHIHIAGLLVVYVLCYIGFSLAVFYRDFGR
jgi:hypothetical protein